MTKGAELTDSDNYFEDFNVGTVWRHARGKTITDFECSTLALLVMNTAQGHFNDDVMKSSPHGRPVVFGGVTAALVIGLAMQDTGEHALVEEGLDQLRYAEPVFRGDTIYAVSEVKAVNEISGFKGGRVTFHHTGLNDQGRVVFECDRTVVIGAHP
jgi:itaconyl-CoA hydratase